MGNCHNADFTQTDTSEELNKLMKENLLFLKGILFHFIESNSLGAAIKLQNVLTLTHRYYSDTRQLRTNLLSYEDELTRQEGISLDKILLSELKQLKITHSILKKIYSQLKQLWISPSVAQINKFILSAQSEHQDRINRLNLVYSRMQIKNSEINSAVYEINKGDSLSLEEEDLILQVCKVTTYFFNNKHARIDYSSIRKRASRKAKTFAGQSLYRKEEFISV